MKASERLSDTRKFGNVAESVHSIMAGLADFTQQTRQTTQRLEQQAEETQKSYKVWQAEWEQAKEDIRENNRKMVRFSWIFCLVTHVTQFGICNT